ncbi:NAD(P)-dependent oxidoreductase [Mycobacterium sp. AT1]|uniref:NAD(P)-dependent oxidoreductase n=1 Tax=Mycobacterium sp. AT1 TaxID=1961706 RepID=UPI00130203CC|nr:NAD(P)-dependent oxidoreductase [Mycobacterium sp. AT1]
MKTVGFVGTGAMGSAMVHRLLELGYPVVVHNRTKANAQALISSGACWAGSVAEVAQQCSVIVGCLRDTAAVEEVYLGPRGLLDSARPGTIMIEHATFAPELARRISRAADRRECHFLDIPVTGGPTGAREGTLAGMAGGNLAAIEAIRHVVEPYIGALLRIGESGRGLELKLVNQLLVTTHMAAAAEANALLRRLGLPLDTSFEVLTHGWANSTMLARSMAQLSSDTVEGTGVTIEGMREVQAVIESMLESTEFPLPVFQSARGYFETAADVGRGQSDPAALADHVCQMRRCTDDPHPFHGRSESNGTPETSRDQTTPSDHSSQQ